MENIKDTFENALQESAHIKNLLNSEGWKILMREVERRRESELSVLLLSIEHIDLIRSQSLVRAYDSLKEIANDIMLSGDNAQRELEVMKKYK